MTGEMLIQNKKIETVIPQQDIESLARILLPKIQEYFESEEGQREFAEWKQQQEQKKINTES